jgi:hypothetical protein
LTSRAAPTVRAALGWPAFVLGAAAVALACRAALHGRGFGAHPRLVGAAVTFDLTVTMAALAWATVVRSGRLRARSLLAVVTGGLLAARLLLPADAGEVARGARASAALAELGLAGWVAWSLAAAWPRVRGRVRSGAVPLEEAVRCELAARVGRRRAVDALVTEVSLLAFALGSWRARPHVPPAAEPFSAHRRSALGAALLALAFAGVGETVGVHLLLARWSGAAAWGATALSAYSGLWLLGDFRAVALRPVLLARDRLEVRIGLRWRATVPLDRVRAICAGPDAGRHRGAAVASALGPPNVYLHLDGPAELEGVLGLRRRGDCLGVRVDEPERLLAALGARCPGA